jgi:hypothetical protein
MALLERGLPALAPTQHIRRSRTGELYPLAAERFPHASSAAKAAFRQRAIFLVSHALRLDGHQLNKRCRALGDIDFPPQAGSAAEEGRQYRRRDDSTTR